MIVLEVTAMLSDISLRGGFCLVAGCLLAVIRVELDVALRKRTRLCPTPGGGGEVSMVRQSGRE